jgi:hypothetical protein
MAGRKTTSKSWSRELRFDPVAALLAFENAAARLLTRRQPDRYAWLTLAVCRVFKRFFA